MSEFKVVPGGVCAPKGFSASGVHAGLRHNPRTLDLAILQAEGRCAAAGVFTTNKVYGAPIKVDRAHLKDGYAQAIVVNSGNANTCAANGVALATQCCELTAQALGIDAADVLPASTGVIGQPMVIAPYERGLPEAAAPLPPPAPGSTPLSVDLDTSTTDTLLLLASGLAGNDPVTEEGPDYEAFLAALYAVAGHMCALHASDGEGATHLITCEVTHAPSHEIARAIAKSVVCSNLFKAAVFGRDANWGRILCAIGYTPGDFSIDHVAVRIASAAGEVHGCENAGDHPCSEEEAARILGAHAIRGKVARSGDAI